MCSKLNKRFWLGFRSKIYEEDWKNIWKKVSFNQKVLNSSPPKISVTEQLTKSQSKTHQKGISIGKYDMLFKRSIIRNFSKKSKQRNSQELNQSGKIFRVRGTLSKGLYLNKREAKSLFEKRKKKIHNAQSHFFVCEFRIFFNDNKKLIISYSMYCKR